MQLPAFPPSQKHPLPPSQYFGTPFPHPTNRWWQNLVLGNGDELVKTHPYLIKAKEHTLECCLPKVIAFPNALFEQYEMTWQFSSNTQFTSKV